jgi:SAM-dependent methyltransferase
MADRYLEAAAVSAGAPAVNGIWPNGLAARYFKQFGDARRLLDVGCGIGELGRCQPSSEVEVHGVDINAAAVKLAARHENVICLDLDSSALPYEDESFDAVLVKDILEHVLDPGRLAREIYRVLRPGGVVVASVVMARPKRVWADYTHVRGFTRSAARQLLEDAGLPVEAIWRMGAVPLSGRLHLIWLVPQLLRLPLFDELWAASWELRARK